MSAADHQTTSDGPPLKPRELAVLRALACLRLMTRSDVEAIAHRSMVHDSSVSRDLLKLVTRGYCHHFNMDGLPIRDSYGLAYGAAKVLPVASALTASWRLEPAPETAFYLLQRASLWSALTKDGWTVGNRSRARLALRRSLVDRQRTVVDREQGKAKEVAGAVLARLRAAPDLSPHAEMRCVCGFSCSPKDHRRCPRCKSDLKAVIMESAAQCGCGAIVDLDHPPAVQEHKACGHWRLLPPLPYDVADKAGEVMILLCDNPRASIVKQAAALPLRVLGQPRLSVVLRPCDDNSLYDAVGKRWVMKGPRLRLLEHLFSDDHLAGHFPYATTADVVDYRPEAQLRVLKRGAAA